MQVNVRLFASLHELIGKRDVVVELADGATVAQLRDQLQREYPIVTAHLPTLVVAVDEEYVTPEHTLRDGADVALIPPVSGGSDDDILVTREPLDPARLTAAVRQDESGAVVLFHGVARNHSEGRTVRALEYDAYVPMSERKLREVADEARERWPLTGFAVHHRVGRLEIGEASLLVVVSAAHRQEAFEACHYAVDRIKQIVPVWKKELFEDGDGDWVPGYTVDVTERSETKA